jgi:hypothetical protein
MSKRAIIIGGCFIGIINSAFAIQDRSNDSEYIMPSTLEQSGVDSFNFEVFESVDQTQFDLPDCSTSIPNLQACIPHACKLKTAFGDMFIKVKGMQGEKCLYVERTLGIDGINCQFAKNDLPQLNGLFAKRLQKLSGFNIAMDEATVSKLHNVFKNNCASVPDYNLSKTIPLNKINTNEVDPEFADMGLKKKTYNTQARPPATPYDSNNHIENLKNYKSIMLPLGDTVSQK